jgi:hypothetical protein
VDHQVDCHTRRDSWREWPYPADIDMDQARKVPGQLDHGRVEPLHMANHQDTVMLLRGGDKTLGLLNGRRDRLFHEHVEPVFQQHGADLHVRLGGHRDDRRVHRTRERIHGRQVGGADMFGELPALVLVLIDHDGYFGGGDGTGDPGMAAAHHSCSDDCEPNHE